MFLEIPKIKLQLQALHLLIMLLPEANRDTAKVSLLFYYHLPSVVPVTFK